MQKQHKVKEPSLPYLPIAEKRIVGCTPFLRALVLGEMKTALNKIWTWVAMPISYEYNNYTMSIL